jgi:hypothetical protein
MDVAMLLHGPGRPEPRLSGPMTPLFVGAWCVLGQMYGVLVISEDEIAYPIKKKTRLHGLFRQYILNEH